jgi:hypothetical protein
MTDSVNDWLRGISPDLAARQLSMAAFLYYRCAASPLSDDTYDALSGYVALNFDLLDPAMQERLESADAVRTTGHHIYVTRQGYEAALQWARVEHGLTFDAPPFSADAEQDTPAGVVEIMSAGG